MGHRPLVYTSDLVSLQLAGRVSDVLPKLAARSRKYHPHLICPICGEDKSKGAKRCRSCFKRQQHMVLAAHKAGIPLVPATPSYGSSRRRGKEGTTPPPPATKSMVKQADGTWRTEEWIAPKEVSMASPLSTSKQDWQKDNTIPPHTNSEVARVMEEQNVGRRRAYEIVRRQNAASIDTNGVGQSQRVAVMSCLIAQPASGKSSWTLLEALHEAGVKIDIHDVNKTLWALQKTNYVRFRNRDRTHELYAIVVTRDGLDIYDSMSRMPANITEAVLEEEATASVALDHDPEVQTIMVAPEMPENPPPWILAFGHEWSIGPALGDLLRRADRANKINAAAKLLEEAGEDEIALNLMSKTDFSQLEEEVIDILRKLGVA